jgi:hypothetical protein
VPHRRLLGRGQTSPQTTRPMGGARSAGDPVLRGQAASSSPHRHDQPVKELLLTPLGRLKPDQNRARRIGGSGPGGIADRWPPHRLRRDQEPHAQEGRRVAAGAAWAIRAPTTTPTTATSIAARVVVTRLDLRRAKPPSSERPWRQPPGRRGSCSLYRRWRPSLASTRASANHTWALVVREDR